ncbi:hypothetical protein NP493_681g01079 [Ridgeia piscesae]|uniref:Epidermal retinol dehydrogenase 2 n=2 Tax=Ridgeia piscesae TaxID=27915 RepID=A0AAD9KSV6_RIDPI|nr:hypothetical protein NP493_681g01079 [Ridgeia piscesae]
MSGADTECGIPLVDLMRGLILFIYYWLEGIALAIIPASFQRKSVAGEKVLITGAGSGLGRLLSHRFAKLGCELVLWDVNKEGNEQTAAQVKRLGVKVQAYEVDLSKREDVYKVADMVKKDIGDIDILINNAGIVTGKKFMDSPDSLIQKTMAVNTLAPFWTVKAFLPAMLRRNHGHVVTIASAAGLFGVTGLADYCASKCAVIGFDDSLRDELAYLGKDGIITTVVCPFYINTGMFDGVKSKFPLLLPIMDPDWVANKIVDGVLCNQRMLILPRILYFLLFIKSILPVKCAAIANKYLGASSAMDEFKGRSVKCE